MHTGGVRPKGIAIAPRPDHDNSTSATRLAINQMVTLIAHRRLRVGSLKRFKPQNVSAHVCQKAGIYFR